MKLLCLSPMIDLKAIDCFSAILDASISISSLERTSFSRAIGLIVLTEVNFFVTRTFFLIFFFSFFLTGFGFLFTAFFLTTFPFTFLFAFFFADLGFLRTGLETGFFFSVFVAAWLLFHNLTACANVLPAFNWRLMKRLYSERIFFGLPFDFRFFISFISFSTSRSSFFDAASSFVVAFFVASFEAAFIVLVDSFEAFFDALSIAFLALDATPLTCFVAVFPLTTFLAFEELFLDFFDAMLFGKNN